MISFWDYLLDNWPGFLVFCFVGFLFGLLVLTDGGRSVKEKLKVLAIHIFMWGCLAWPLISSVDYHKAKNHYVSCNKPVAKRAGYIYSDYKCWAPARAGTYVGINEKLKTEQELRNEP